MAATITAGHHAVVYISGTPTSMSTEATTKSGSNKIFQITAATKQVLDPNYTQTQNWSAGPTGTITLNRLTGTFTSTADETTHTMTVTGKYLPMTPLLYANDFSLSIKTKATDQTPFNQPYQSVAKVVRDVTGTIGTFYDPTESAALSIAPYFNVEMLADATIALQLYVNANLSLLAWALISDEELKAVLDGNLEQTISWEGDADADGHIISRL
jgi:hypothetical protein